MLVCLVVTLLTILGAAEPAASQNFPSRPITIVLPVPPGGSLDFVLRLIQGKMGDAFGQPLVIESRPGAGGSVGSAYVAKAAPDGYTLLAVPTNIGIFPHIFQNLSYDPIKDFVAVGPLADTPSVCVVNSASKIQSLADLIKEAKDSPGKVKFASSGAGTPSHLETEMIAKLNNVKMIHVPYKGAAPAITDLLGGFTDFFCTGFAGVSPLLQDGKLRAIAVTAEKRSVLLPDIPTVKEAGFGDIDDSSRYVLLAPAMTPKPIIERLSATLAKVLADPSLQQAYLKGGYEVSRTTPSEISAEIQQQYVVWGALVKELNLRSE